MSSLQWFDPSNPSDRSKRAPQSGKDSRRSSINLKSVSGSKAAADVDAIVAATMEAERAGGGQSNRVCKGVPLPSPPTVDKSAEAAETTSSSSLSRALTLQEAGQSIDHALRAKQKLIQEHISDHERKLVDQHQRLKKVREKLDRLEQDQAARISQMQRSVDHLSRELAIREKEANQKKAILEEANKNYLAAAASLDECKKEKAETEKVLMELLLKAGESRDKVMNEMLQSLDTL
ncbi:hypothetical protein FOL47_006322 [Perkinsus chesapeaki]|uniref:Uncharacterized protein n=1 Tax=Perkinsus chesapeaki TaxID=330153 RepID=A0A7J6LTK5_PERCH|nr:hypothetical protein FOL47_006322 [Perkinsus chesapeaki]